MYTLHTPDPFEVLPLVYDSFEDLHGTGNITSVLFTLPPDNLPSHVEITLGGSGRSAITFVSKS